MKNITIQQRGGGYIGTLIADNGTQIPVTNLKLTPKLARESAIEMIKNLKTIIIIEKEFGHSLNKFKL